MIVAINTVFFAKENESDFLKKVFDTIIATHPEHTFLLITTEKPVGDVLPNVTSINPGPPPAQMNRWFFWAYFKLKHVLKKYQPDILINNSDALFYFKKVPQIIFNPDLRFIQDPKSVLSGLRRVYELFAPRYYQKAQRIIVFSEIEKNVLKMKFRVDEQKIKVIHYGAPEEVKPIGYEEREGVKEKYAKGFEYFLYTGYISESVYLMNLLKSFSAFKKRQKSSMQLLIMGSPGIQFNDFQKSVNLYKYKKDVHLITAIDQFESQIIISSAYALIFPNQFDKRSYILLTALKYGVPSLVPNAGSLSEAATDAVVHFEPGNIPDLAGKIMYLFKDEKSRNKLIENSKNWMDEKIFENSIRDTWKIIEEAAG